MGILAAIRASKAASRLDPRLIKSIKKLEGIKGDLTPLNVGEIVRRTGVSLSDSQRAELLESLRTSDKFKGSNVEFNLQRFDKFAAKDTPNAKTLAARQRDLDESIHSQILIDLLNEQPDPGRVKPFPAGLDVAVPIPESQINVLGKIDERLKPRTEVDFTTLKPTQKKATPEGGAAKVIQVDFTTLRPVKPKDES